MLFITVCYVSYFYIYFVFLHVYQYTLRKEYFINQYARLKLRFSFCINKKHLNNTILLITDSTVIKSTSQTFNTLIHKWFSLYVLYFLDLTQGLWQSEITTRWLAHRIQKPLRGRQPITDCRCHINL